jgi:hypothetical protein
MMYDAYYTPEHLADLIVKHVTIVPSIVADFAAGDGSLLRAASRKWPQSKLLGTDIDIGGLRAIRREFQSATLGKCDFMNARSRRHCSALKTSHSSIPLILLNPPFSCRGGKRFETCLQGSFFSSSLALAFVANALSYLAPCGQIIAILPASVMQANKDIPLWNAIKKIAKVELLGWQDRNVFRECAASTCVVRISRYKFDLHTGNYQEPDYVELSSFSPAYFTMPFTFQRGTVPTYRLDLYKRTKGHPYVHTTNLKLQALAGPLATVSKKLKAVSGPMVLIPRVGKPNPGKVVVLLASRAIVMSDCVIAIRATSEADALSVHKLLLDQWTSFQALYHGTGAPYVTVQNLRIWLVSALAKLENRSRRNGSANTTVISSAHTSSVRNISRKRRVL